MMKILGLSADFEGAYKVQDDSNVAHYFLDEAMNVEGNKVSISCFVFDKHLNKWMYSETFIDETDYDSLFKQA